MRREIQINKVDFVVYGNAPFMVLPLKASMNNPDGWFIIETANMALAMTSEVPLRFGVLTKVDHNGKDTAVIFTGGVGKEQADKIVWELNKKL